MDITCSVCTESLISKDDSVSTTQCGHVFHTKCVTQWFQTGKNTCPQCRAISGMNQIIQTYVSKNAKALDVIEADLKCIELAETNKKLEKEKKEMESFIHWILRSAPKLEHGKNLIEWVADGPEQRKVMLLF